MSQFVVSARKYRPSTFDEVIGQDHVAKTLKNALLQDKLAHAFLFCGPRGVGKTTNARILAKVINCENKQDGVNPCNECSSCLSFNDNASFNIIELDAASNNSVEAIRTLIEQVRFQPQQGTHKVFIIDEVHMLSTAAFNAFLKTLEEPPPYAIFILATTEKHKILPTILSRCQVFDFKRIQIADIVKQLEHICQAEQRTAEPEALQMIAQKADGAMRDALSIYDKIASASGDHISYQEVILQLNILDYDYYFRMTDHTLREDFTQVLLTLDEIIKKGFDVELFVQGFAEHLRNLMVCKHPETLKILELSEGAMTRYQHQAQLCSPSYLLSALNILNQCDIKLPTASNKRLYTEIALSKICYINKALQADLSGANIEKKNPDLTEAAAPSPTMAAPKAVPSAPQAMSQEAAQAKEPAAAVTEQKATPAVETPPVQQEKTAPPSPPAQPKEVIKSSSDPSLGASSMMNTPSFSSLDALLNQVKQEEEAKKEAAKQLHIDRINEIWEDHKEKNDSASVKVALKNSFRSLEGKTIHITVPSENAKNIILQEEVLKNRLRFELGTPDIVLDIKVDNSQFPNVELAKPKKLYNNREKYDLMVERNPLIETLKNKFVLKIDK